MSKTIVFAVLVGVVCLTRAELATECPYYLINPAENLAWMNITHMDILYGTVLENKTFEDVLALCRSQKLSKTMEEVNGFINQCTSEDASPTLPVFNIGGFEEAIQYLCQPANLKVLEDNMECFKENMPRLDECRADRMEQALAKDGGNDAVAKACSQQRAHSYCSQKVLGSRCNAELANLKVKMADLVTSTYCDCDEVVERRDISRCTSNMCMNIDGQMRSETDMYEGLLFGAEGLDKIHDICKSTKDGRSYELVRKLEKCAGHTCKWRDHFYKFQIYHKAGILDAAKYFCESQNFIFPAAACVKKNFAPFLDCQKTGWADEQTMLDNEESQDTMNEYICRRRVVTSHCINKHFSSCEGDILDRLNDLWLTRAPRMCRYDCQPIGFGGSSTVTSSLTAIMTLLTTTLMLICK